MSRLIFTKYSNDRNEKYALRTDIFCDEDGKEHLRKVPIYTDGMAHLEHMVLCGDLLQERYGENVIVAKSEATDYCAEIEFVSGTSLSKILQEILISNDKNKLLEVLELYRTKMFSDKEKKQRFIPAPEFITVFGEHDFTNIPEQLTASITDVDLIFDNILVKQTNNQDIWYLIDYEWTFTFAIPEKFVIYRTLFYWFSGSSVSSLMDWDEILRWADISAPELDVFEEMERHFIKHIKGDTKSIEEIALDSHMNMIPFAKLHEVLNLDNGGNATVYYKKDGEYSINNATVHKMNCYYDGLSTVEISNLEGEQEIRLDPIEKSCIVKIYNINADGEDEMSYFSNGIEIEKNIIVFVTDDPQIIFRLDGRVKHLQIQLSICQVADWICEKISTGYVNYNKEIEDYQRRIQDDSINYELLLQKYNCLQSLFVRTHAEQMEAAQKVAKYESTLGKQIKRKIVRVLAKIKKQVKRVVKKFCSDKNGMVEI